MDENAKRIAAWRASKEAEWEQEGSKLRTKHPTRDVFEAWLTKQTQKGKTQANAKARGGSAPGPAGGAAARRPAPDEPKIVELPDDEPAAAPAPGEDGKLVGPGAASAMQMAARAISELLAKGKAQYQAKEYAKCIESHENVIKFVPQVLGCVRVSATLHVPAPAATLSASAAYRAWQLLGGRGERAALGRPG